MEPNVPSRQSLCWPRLLAAWLAGSLVVTASEIVRNEVVIHHLWSESFRAMGKEYPSGPLPGVVWLVWCLGLTALLCWVYVLVSTRYGFGLRAAVIAAMTVWVNFFVLFWAGMMNMGLMSVPIMLVATTWSLAELIVAAAAVSMVYREKPTPK